jgi:hypothetical protein
MRCRTVGVTADDGQRRQRPAEYVGHVVGQPDALAERILTRKVHLCEPLIDDGIVLSGRAVDVGERSAAYGADANGLEVLRADAEQRDDGRPLVRFRPPFDRELDRAATTQRPVTRRGGRFQRTDGRQPFIDAPDERVPIGRAGIFAKRERQLHREEA